MAARKLKNWAMVISVNEYPVAFFAPMYVYNDAAMRIPLEKSKTTETMPQRRARLLLASDLLRAKPLKIARRAATPMAINA